MGSAAGSIISQCGYNNGGWTYYDQEFHYAGFSYGVKYVAIIQFKTPEFTGAARSIIMTMVGAEFRPSGGDPVLRWALCSSDANRDSYANPGEVTDEYQMVAGEITFTDEMKEKELVIENNEFLPDTTYYLMLWGHTPDAMGRISLLATSYNSVRIEYDEGVVYIDFGSGYEPYMICIDNGTSWDQYIPCIDNGTNWDQCG